MYVYILIVFNAGFIATICTCKPVNVQVARSPFKIPSSALCAYRAVYLCVRLSPRRVRGRKCSILSLSSNTSSPVSLPWRSSQVNTDWDRAKKKRQSPMWTLWEIDWTERRLKRSVSFYYNLTLFIHKHCRIQCANNNQLYPRFLYYKLTLPLVVCRLNEFNQILIIVFDNFLTRQISQVFLHLLFSPTPVKTSWNAKN